MTTRDIADQIKDLYDMGISAEFISKITNGLLPECSEKADGVANAAGKAI